MSSRVFSSGFALVLLLATSCSVGSLGNGQGERSQAEAEEIARLKRLIVELEQRAVMAEVEARRLERQLAELEAEAGAQKRATDSKDVANPSRINIERPSAVEGAPMPSGSVEVSDLLETVEKAPAARNVEPVGLPDAESAAEAEEILTATAQALYDRGYTLFHQGHFVDSETAFQQFLQGFGSTVLGDNAQFWIAEARYARGDVDGAIAAFQETVSRFPEGNKAPDAGLKIGDCLRDLGDSEGARRSYRRVIQDHPSSAAAEIARDRLVE